MAVCLVLVYSLPSIIWSVSSVLSATAELVTLMSELATKWSKVVASAVMSNDWIQLVLIRLIYDAEVYVLQPQFQPESIELESLSLPGPIKYLCFVLTTAELSLGIWLLSIAMGMMLVYIVLIFVLAVMVYRILRTVRRNGSFTCWVIWDQVRSGTYLLLELLELVVVVTAMLNILVSFLLWLATKWLVVIWSATIWSATKWSATAACRWSATIWSTVKWLSPTRSASSPVPLVSSWP